MSKRDTKGQPDKTRKATLRLLRRAHELIEQPGTWTKGKFARDRHSHPVSPTSDRAVRFCVAGALLRAAGEEFRFNIRIASPGEPDNFQLPEALNNAYRALAGAIVGLVCPAYGITLIDEDNSDPTISRLTIEVPVGDETVTEHLTAASLVQTFNDVKPMTQQGMLLCLQAAQAAVMSLSGGEAQ